jgi:hypothetical protein
MALGGPARREGWVRLRPPLHVAPSPDAPASEDRCWLWKVGPIRVASGRSASNAEEFCDLCDSEQVLRGHDSQTRGGGGQTDTGEYHQMEKLIRYVSVSTMRAEPNDRHNGGA